MYVKIFGNVCEIGTANYNYQKKKNVVLLHAVETFLFHSILKLFQKSIKQAGPAKINGWNKWSSVVVQIKENVILPVSFLLQWRWRMKSATLECFQWKHGVIHQQNRTFEIFPIMGLIKQTN